MDEDAELDEELRREFEDGHHGAVLTAIFLAFECDCPVPDWARAAFRERYSTHVTARSWDEVFGKLHRKGEHALTRKLDARKWDIHRRVRELHEQGQPIDTRLFRRVGKELRVGGATVVKAIYYPVEQALRRFREK